jgi:hypothetical protein
MSAPLFTPIVLFFLGLPLSYGFTQIFRVYRLLQKELYSDIPNVTMLNDG